MLTPLPASLTHGKVGVLDGGCRLSRSRTIKGGLKFQSAFIMFSTQKVNSPYYTVVYLKYGAIYDNGQCKARI